MPMARPTRLYLFAGTLSVVLQAALSPLKAADPPKARPDPLTEAAVEFQLAVRDTGAALAAADTASARATMRKAWEALAKIRMRGGPATLRKLTGEILRGERLGAHIAAGLDKIAAELDQVLPEETALVARRHLGRAREALKNKQAAAVRDETAAVLDALIAARIGLPVVEWVGAMKKAEAALAARVPAERQTADALTALGPIGDPANFRAQAFVGLLDLADTGIVTATEAFKKGYNRDGLGALKKVTDVLTAAERAAPDDESKMDTAMLPAKVKESADGFLGEAADGFNELQEVREEIARLKKEFAPKEVLRPILAPKPGVEALRKLRERLGALAAAKGAKAAVDMILAPRKPQGAGHVDVDAVHRAIDELIAEFGVEEACRAIAMPVSAGMFAAAVEPIEELRRRIDQLHEQLVRRAQADGETPKRP
jgi:hypothetical protein